MEIDPAPSGSDHEGSVGASSSSDNNVNRNNNDIDFDDDGSSDSDDVHLPHIGAGSSTTSTSTNPNTTTTSTSASAANRGYMSQRLEEQAEKKVRTNGPSAAIHSQQSVAASSGDAFIEQCKVSVVFVLFIDSYIVSDS